MTRTYRQPDLNAPRFRPKKLNLVNQQLYERFLKEHPRYGDLNYQQFKDIISTFNGMIRQKVVDTRDGVELPEQLGNIFIGSCPRVKKENIDHQRSLIYGKRVQHQNWESDQFTAKILYTNYEQKYSFKNHELWGFKAHRDFSRNVAHTYPQQWKRYIQVDNLVKVSLLFRNQRFQDKKTQQTIQLLDTYDEFNLD